MTWGLSAIALVSLAVWLVGLALILRRRAEQQGAGGGDYLPTWYLLVTGTAAAVALLLLLRQRANSEKAGEDETDLLIRSAKLSTTAETPDAPLP